MAIFALWLCGCILLAICHIPSTSAVCQASNDYSRTVLVPLHGTAAFVCNVTGLKAQLYMEDQMFWWPGVNINIAGIDPKFVGSNRTINVTVNGNMTSLNKTSITCYCYDGTTESYPVPTFVTTILIHLQPNPSVSAQVQPSSLSPSPSSQSSSSQSSSSHTPSSQSPSSHTPSSQSSSSQSPLSQLRSQSTALPSQSSAMQLTITVPLLVCVVVAGFVILVLTVAAISAAAVRSRRKRRHAIDVAGQTATQRDPRDTITSLNAYPTPHA